MTEAERLVEGIVLEQVGEAVRRLVKARKAAEALPPAARAECGVPNIVEYLKQEISHVANIRTLMRPRKDDEDHGAAA